MSSAGVSPGRGCSGRAKVTVVLARRLRPRPLGITSAVPSMWTGMIGAPAVSASSETPCAVAVRAGAAGALREEQHVAAVAQVGGRRGEAAALAAAAVERERVDPEGAGDRVAALAVEAVARGADDGPRAPRVRAARAARAACRCRSRGWARGSRAGARGSGPRRRSRSAARPAASRGTAAPAGRPRAASAGRRSRSHAWSSTPRSDHGSLPAETVRHLRGVDSRRVRVGARELLQPAPAGGELHASTCA